MKINTRHYLIKHFLANMPRGAPFDLAILAEQGVSAQLAAKYVGSGWLIRLAQGIYAFPGDTLTPQGSLKFLQTRIPGLHVAGKTALSLQGVRHNLPLQDRLVLWGAARSALPNWFISRFPSRYVCARLFACTDAFLTTKSLTTPPGSTDGLQVSVPERAILELLYEVGTNQSIEEAHNIFAGVRNLRKDILGKLLACCNSVKTVRLLLTWSRETGVIDADSLLSKYEIPVGSEKRWMTRLKDGTLLSLKPNG